MSKLTEKFKPSKVDPDENLVMSNAGWAVCQMLDELNESIKGLTIQIRRLADK